MSSFPNYLFNTIYNLVMPEVKSAAISEDCKNNINKAVVSSSSEATNNLPDVVVVPAPEVVVDTRPVIVFDIDDTLCVSLNSYNEQAIEKDKLLNPEAASGSWKTDKYGFWETYQYLCLPYLGSLFNYLIDHKVRIAFFSAGFKERNLALLEQVLPQYLGEESYKTLKAQGQFKIFSADDLTASYHKNPGEGTYVKDLNKVLSGGEQRNAILIDDDSSYVKADQHPYIQPLDLSHWHVRSQKENYNSFAKNGAYYLLGIFKKYFEKEQYSSLELKDGIAKVYEERKVSIFTRYHANSENPFVREMIYIGLEEVQKTNAEAVLYGEKVFKELLPIESEYFF